MMSLPFNFCYSVISLQLQVGPIIICLVVDGVACPGDKWGYVVILENMCGPIIEVAVMALKDEDMGVDLDIYTSPT